MDCPARDKSRRRHIVPHANGGMQYKVAVHGVTAGETRGKWLFAVDVVEELAFDVFVLKFA